MIPGVSGKDTDMARGILYSIVSAIALGTLAVFAKIGLAMGMTPLELVQYRFTFGAMMLFGWIGLTRPHMLRISPRALLKALVLGLGLYPFQSWFFIKALQYLPAATASLIYYLYPLVTTLIAVVFMRMRPGRTVTVALLLILAGCGLVFYNAFAQNADIRGIRYALACMCTFSVYLTLVQIFTRNDDATRIGPWVILFMAVTFSLLSSPLTILDQNFTGVLIALGLGLFPTALAITLLYRAVQSIGSVYTSMFSTVEPVTTVLLACFILDEPVDVLQILGMFTIIAGIALPNLGLLLRRNT